MKNSKILKILLIGGLLLLTNSLFASTKLYQGLGKSSNFRVGPGKDSKGVDVYSINYVTASGVFDEEGRIVNLRVDALEVSTPNYDGASMPHFSGWPNTQGYNVTDHESGEVVSISSNTVENISKEVDEWKTKRERGAAYGMNPRNEWDKQMDFYENYFRGKTVAEIEEWFAKYTSDVNGRPLKARSRNEQDKIKYEKLSEKEKADLVDIVAGATMSLKDNHGDILGAIKDAYNNRVEFIID
jgi:hypothetical protein